MFVEEPYWWKGCLGEERVSLGFGPISTADGAYQRTFGDFDLGLFERVGIRFWRKDLRSRTKGEGHVCVFFFWFSGLFEVFDH